MSVVQRKMKMKFWVQIMNKKLVGNAVDESISKSQRMKRLRRYQKRARKEHWFKPVSKVARKKRKQI